MHAVGDGGHSAVECCGEACVNGRRPVNVHNLNSVPVLVFDLRTILLAPKTVHLGDVVVVVGRAYRYG